MSPAHDVFTYGALNRSGYDVYVRLLDFGAAFLPEVAKHVDWSRDTVKRSLERLADHGMVEVSDGVWSAVERDLDEVAEELLVRHWPVAGRGQRRQLRYDLDRNRRNRALTVLGLLEPRERDRNRNRKPGRPPSQRPRPARKRRPPPST